MSELTDMDWMNIAKASRKIAELCMKFAEECEKQIVPPPLPAVVVILPVLSPIPKKINSGLPTLADMERVVRNTKKSQSS